MSLHLAVLLLAVAGLLWAEFNERPGARAVFKLSASSVFIAEGLSRGLMDTGPGSWVFAGLVGCFLGDAALLSRHRLAFLGGLGAFLLGHLAFAVAFGLRGPSWLLTGALLVALLVPARVVHRWLMPHVEPAMRVPVLAYMTVITVMVALAIGLTARTHTWLLAGGAVAFYISDLAVARDRFIEAHPLNHLWGAPAYFLGVWLMAHAFPL